MDTSIKFKKHDIKKCLFIYVLRIQISVVFALFLSLHSYETYSQSKEEILEYLRIHLLLGAKKISALFALFGKFNRICRQELIHSSPMPKYLAPKKRKSSRRRELRCTDELHTRRFHSSKSFSLVVRKAESGFFSCVQTGQRGPTSSGFPKSIQFQTF